MTIKELQDKRAQVVTQMEALVEKRSDSMDETTLSAIKSFKDEVSQIDREIDAINELRSVAVKTAMKPEDKKVDAQAELRGLFKDYMRGDLTQREFEKRANTVGANGADIVPEDFYRELFETINEYGTVYDRARKITTSDNGQVQFPIINDTANTGLWTDELGSIAKADFATGTVTMNAYKVTSGIQVSTELLEDSFFNVESYISSALGTRIGRAVENAFIFGDGVDKPEGVCVNTNTVNATSAAAGAVTSDDLISMIHMLPATQRIGSVFLVSDAVMGALLVEKDADGRPLLQPAAQATAADDIQYTLAGYPVIANYELQDIATGNKVAIFGNWSNYLIREVRGINVKRDDYSNMSTDAVNFYVTNRLDGKVVAGNTVFVDLEVA